MIRTWPNITRLNLRGFVAALAFVLFQFMALSHAAQFEFREHKHHGLPCAIITAVEQGHHLDLAADQLVPVCGATYDAPVTELAEALTRPSLPLPTTRAPPAL
ncbi:MAG: hypothetical protein EP347_01640 [Alphaproteobacteria bacterium]|nr:MAG: hypothetical protein EP347_01640 [Alphaproteobacteria bacterium]